MTCFECGTRYEPMTDSYKCPGCGMENYPEETEAYWKSLIEQAKKNIMERDQNTDMEKPNA